MTDLEQLKLEFEREKHADEVKLADARLKAEQRKLDDANKLASDRMELDRRQAGRYSTGAVTLIGAVIAVISAIATSTIGGWFGLQGTTSDNLTALDLKQREIDGEIKVQTLIAEAERDRLEIQQKFDIIVQATKGLPREEASANLVFYVEAGILQDTKDGKILALAEKGIAPTTPTESVDKAPANPLLQRVADHCPADASDSEKIVIAGGVICGGGGLRIEFVPTPNFSLSNQPRYMIIDFTGAESLKSTVAWFGVSRARASAHLVIGRNGGVIQMLPFDRAAWHAGSSTWGSTKGMNSHSVGIELANWGMLEGGENDWRTWTDRPIPTEKVLVAPHRFNEERTRGWETYEIAQIDAVKKIVKAMAESDLDIIDVIGQDDVSPARKLGPGPAFPMEEVRQAAFGRAEALTPP